MVYLDVYSNLCRKEVYSFQTVTAATDAALFALRTGAVKTRIARPTGNGMYERTDVRPTSHWGEQ